MTERLKELINRYRPENLQLKGKVRDWKGEKVSQSRIKGCEEVELV